MSSCARVLRRGEEDLNSRLLVSEAVGELGLLLRSKESRESIGKDGSDVDVGEGDSVTDKEGVGGEVSLENWEDGSGLLDSVLEDLCEQRREARGYQRTDRDDRAQRDAK